MTAKKKAKKKASTRAGSNYTAVVHLDFPDEDSMGMVVAAGGRRNLTEEQRSQLTLEHIAESDTCERLPKASIEGCHRSGKIRHKDDYDCEDCGSRVKPVLDGPQCLVCKEKK